MTDYRNKYSYSYYLTHRPFEMFIDIKDGMDLTQLSKKSNLTYYYPIKCIKDLENVGLVSTKKVGRTRIINLTNKGKKIQSHLIKIKKILDYDI